MRYLVADILTNVIRAEIPFSNVSYTLPLNDHGTFGGTVPARLPVVTPDVIAPATTVIYVENDDGDIEWGGIVWTSTPSEDGESVDVSGQEFGSYFTHRFIEESVTYPDVDQLTIARDLITRAQAVVGGNIRIEHKNPTQLSGVTQYHDYHGYELPEVMQSIHDLAEAEKGFDWCFTAEWGDDDQIHRYLNLYYPRLGHRTENVLELGTNAVLVRNPVDATEMANQVLGLGNGEGSAMIRATATDTSSFSRYPLLQKQVSYKDTDFQSELQSRVNTDLKIANKPTLTPTVDLRYHPYHPWGVFTRGDDVYIRGNDGYLQLDGYYRVQKVTTQVSGGAKKVTIDTADADNWSYGQIPVDGTTPTGY